MMATEYQRQRILEDRAAWAPVEELYKRDDIRSFFGAHADYLDAQTVLSTRRQMIRNMSRRVYKDFVANWAKRLADDVAELTD